MEHINTLLFLQALIVALAIQLLIMLAVRQLAQREGLLKSLNK
jgi:hypothetical protein